MMGEQSGGGEGTHLGPERMVLFPVGESWARAELNLQEQVGADGFTTAS